MTKTAVVILNYNGEKFLRKFLPSVIEHSASAEVIVADNGSTDTSREVLKKEFPQVRLLTLDRNYGFCGGYNRALAQIEATYYVLLNSDIEVTPGWIEPIVAMLDNHADIDAAQPKILSYHNKHEFEYAGAAGGFIDSLGYPYCRGRIFSKIEHDAGQYDDERRIFWATGACLFIRAQTFHKFQGFDESFFAHMEEIDLCWKINRTPQKVYYCGKSVVYHVGAGTLGYGHPQKTYLNFRNGLALIYKHFDSTELVYKIPGRLMLDWLAAFVYLVKGKPKHMLAILKAHVHFLRSLPESRVKRQLLRQQHPTYSRASIHHGLIIVDYYLKRNTTFNNPR